MRNEEEEDRLSNLPDHLLHQIFPSFHTKDLIRKTCLLSKRWRNFWVSVPYLFFEINVESVDWEDANKVFSCNEDFIDRVLLPRRGCSELQRLRLRWCFIHDANRLNAWINAALIQQVQEMDIYLEYRDNLNIELPSQLFTSSIRAFKLESDYWCPGLRLPDSMLSASCLTSLELVFVVLPEGNSKGELVLSCPVLESLILDKCGQSHLKVLNLSAKQLKKLEIHNFDFERRTWDDYLIDCRLELHTPKLLNFVYEGSSHVDYTFGDLAELMSVNISFCAMFTCSNFPGTLIFEQQILEEAAYASKLLSGLNMASNLALEGISIFFTNPDRLGELLTSYRNLKKLELRTFIASIFDVTRLASFLRNCPFIETLILRVHQGSRERDEVESVPPLMCTLKHLKYVAVREVAGLNCELELLRFLFNNAMKLERTVITGFASTNYGGKRMVLMKFKDKLMLLAQQFPSVKVSFSIL